MAFETTAVIPFKKPTEDDFESQQKRNVRQPEMCVDYLSYTFDEMDLAASWRVMTKQKKEVVDGIRLENASWRTWAKQRNNLKTISPQTLNWLKDSDVTWLYGPLHTVIRTEEDPFLIPKEASTADTLGLMVNNTGKQQPPLLKSALKRFSTTDLLKRSATELVLLHHDNTTDVVQQSRRKASISEVNNQLQAVSPSILASHRQPRLRFNHQVEQCIAITTDDDDEREMNCIQEEDSSEGDEDTDEITTSHINYSISYSSSDDYSTAAASGGHFTPSAMATLQRKSIKKIAPARLKKSQSDADTDDISSISSTSSTSSSLGYNSALTRSPMVSPPAIAPKANDNFKEPDVEQAVKKDSPIKPIIMNRTSSNLITQPYKEKSNAAEPALVTMHQTADNLSSCRSLSDKENKNLLNHIATWAASYLWPATTTNNGSTSGTSDTSIRATTTTNNSSDNTLSHRHSTAAIPIERRFAPPSSPNTSSL